MKYWWLKLARYAPAERWGLLFIGIASLAGIGIQLLTPWPLKLIVDHVLTERALPQQLSGIEALPGAGSQLGLLAWLAGATVALFLARRLLGISRKYLEAGTGNKMVYRLASDLFQQLQDRSLSFHTKVRVGDLVRRVTSDCGCVRDLIMNIYLPIITSLVTLVAMLIVMWQLSPPMALLALGLVLPLGLITKWLARPMSDHRYREMELQGEMMALAEQTLTAIPMVQAFGREQHEQRRFEGLTQRTIRANLRTLLSQEQFKVCTSGLTKVATAVVMAVGGMSVLQGTMTVGSLLVVLSYFAALYAPIESLAYLGLGFASAGAGARRVFEVISPEAETVKEAPDATPLPARENYRGGHVYLEGVTFGYQPGRPVLHDISLEAKPGEIVALVGRTGAGKSTLLSLIARLYDPWQGTIRFDGVDVRQLQLRSLRDNIAFVMQEPFLFRVTVAENIAYGRPAASRDEIIAAAKAAAADSFIRRLPQGYDTVIGERGETLSGGEKQRLSIARALLKDAPLLILDEPTSALDPETETSLLEAMERLMEGRTTFIIAHRLSTIRKADRVIVLERGRIVEAGSHGELLAAGGTYAMLEHLQFGRNSYTSQSA
jgi:ATP-binding cassette subfamily B protein/subfamily B ATP-binding cassette protein MsbA